MGDRGGTATTGLETTTRSLLYPMGDRGGTATKVRDELKARGLYPMGDRGGTATEAEGGWRAENYTRWEIGGEPQPTVSSP